MVKNCINYGNVVALAKTATPNHAGAAGISAFVKTAEIVNCVNYGEISFADYLNDNTGVGGIIGKFHSSAGSIISNCYNFGSITGKDNDTTQTGLIGGLLQVIGTIENCYSVPSGTLEIGGSGAISGFELKDNKIVAKTDAEYAAMESAAAAIEEAFFATTIPLTIHYVYSNGDKAVKTIKPTCSKERNTALILRPLPAIPPIRKPCPAKWATHRLNSGYIFYQGVQTDRGYVFEDGSKAADLCRTNPLAPSSVSSLRD